MIDTPKSFWHNKAQPDLSVEIKLREKFLAQNFSQQIFINDQKYASALFPEKFRQTRPYMQNIQISYRDIGEKYIGSRAIMKYKLSLKNDYGTKFRVESIKELVDIELGSGEINPLDQLSNLANRSDHANAYKTDLKKLEDSLLRSAVQQLEQDFTPFLKKRFKRISPDRNILPEEDDIENLEVRGDGRGVTNIIQNFYNQEILDRSVIERDILKDLNQIFEGDAEFLSITPRKKRNGKWEIALEEESKGLISLSQSGSSLKTVMILLVHIHLVPITEKENLSNYIFSIEELENNLHPSLLRRLLMYISKRAKKDECIFFMATHSSIAIDMFIGDEDAQILHVTHDSNSSTVGIVTSHLKCLPVLEDLGVRASDLLQANGIVWVEGPSDVLYIEKWLEMYCRENQKELLDRGIQYEFQMFGGALLDSLCLVKNGAEEEEEYKKLVSMLSFSRNAFVVIDSDAVKKNVKGNEKIVDKSKFSLAKKYIKTQFEELSKHDLNLGLWYKAGNTSIRTLEEYLDRDTLDNFGTQEASKKTKKIYAQMVTQSWNNDKKIEDFPHSLKKEVEVLYRMISKWNQ